MNLPNKLSLTRIFMIPLFCALFYIEKIPYNYVWSAIVFVLAALTDFLDGYIARKYNMVTNLGKLLDPVADKVLVLTAFTLMVTKSYVFVNPVVGGVCVAIIVAREFVVTFLRLIATEKQIVIAADKMGKIKTTLQDVSIVLMLLSVDFFGLTGGYLKPFNIVALVFFISATALTLISGVEIFIKNKEVLKG